VKLFSKKIFSRISQKNGEAMVIPNIAEVIICHD
jgi:hypothetical protein